MCIVLLTSFVTSVRVEPHWRRCMEHVKARNHLHILLGWLVLSNLFFWSHVRVREWCCVRIWEWDTLLGVGTCISIELRFMVKGKWSGPEKGCSMMWTLFGHCWVEWDRMTQILHHLFWIKAKWTSGRGSWWLASISHSATAWECASRCGGCARSRDLLIWEVMKMMMTWRLGWLIVWITASIGIIKMCGMNLRPKNLAWKLAQRQPCFQKCLVESIFKLKFPKKSMMSWLLCLWIIRQQVVEGMKTEVKQLETLKVGRNMTETEARKISEEKTAKILTSRWVNTQKNPTLARCRLVVRHFCFWSRECV